MAKGLYQKCKLLYLMKIFMERTDEKHGMTLQEISGALEEYQISADRKTLYDDFDMLKHFGLDIVGEQREKGYCYRLVSREFEIAELKLLVDSVQSAKFITEKKSNELIKKLEALTSRYEASHLQRQVYVSGRVKAINEKILYSVDMIHEAISKDRKIRFQYFQWNERKEMILRHNGEYYSISPWGLSWDDENYYMVGYDGEAKSIKHYRVDKMINVACTELPRDGKDAFCNLNMADYSRKMFSMFDGEERNVKIMFRNELAGIAIDRFGKEQPFVPTPDGKHFTVNVRVAVSRHFFSWIMSLGEGVKLVGPQDVVEQMRSEAEQLYRRYGEKTGQGVDKASGDKGK